MHPFRVHKFGGSSVADAECMRRVAAILRADPHPRLAVVVSACRGVTDVLLGLVSGAERQDASVEAALETLRLRHAGMAGELLDDEQARVYVDALDRDCRDVAGILHTVRLTRSASGAVRDLVVGFGELWSSQLMAAHLTRTRDGDSRGIAWVDARDLIRIDHGPLGPGIRWDESREHAARLMPRGDAAMAIVPGFVARDGDGLQTTLGRNGSDFSAAIVAALVDAEAIVIWTDVDGILSADPRLVPEATLIDSLSYQEAMELAYFGAKVLHPQTMGPAVARSIPIWIRNTFNPQHPGTVICERPASTLPVKGITSINEVALVNLEGTGMIGVPGTAERLFAALRQHGISVILISQASSEHSICFAVPLAQAAAAERVVRQAFERELHQAQIQRVELNRDCSIIAVVGDGMAGTPGVAATMFGALSSAGVNIRAIAQGASERNISAMIDTRDLTRALRSVHAGFYLSAHTISIGVIGPGLVGGAFLGQLASQTARLRETFNLDLRLRGVLGSRRMVLADGSLDAPAWHAAYTDGPAANLDAFVAHIDADHLPHAVIVDCTASGEIAERYPEWLARGIHVVTPNKRAGSGDLALLDAIAAARRQSHAHFLYEATVGAGLPIVQTLRDLRETGDDIRRIEGILSGTLSYLFNVWDGRQPFSAILADARRQGFTEPDPRDDLSGIDVGRKLIILAREMGLRLELADLTLENLVPPALAACSTEQFLDRAQELDVTMSARLSAATAAHRVLRYVGALDAATGQATVGLVELERTHPFANINLTDNVVRYVTARYDRNPLVVQGPGAGPAVTAGGVFADLLRVCAYLGARR
jgi:bifunctional aspartokinase / homoserine dehydrogenase 1